MLVDPFALLDHARRHGYAVGAYDLIDTTMLDGILRGGEAARAPLILSVAEVHTHQFDEASLLAAVVTAADASPLPIAIHYDHGSTIERLTKATQLGYTSLMYDGSHLPWDENVAATRAAAQLAHRVGMPLEGEIGYVPGQEGIDSELHPGPIQYTDPDEARAFVAATECNWLAVSIGTVHGRLRDAPALDFARLAAIRAALPETPLVIHGGTGLTDEEYRNLVAAGANKINYYTALVEAAAAAAQGAWRWETIREAAISAIAAEVVRTSTLWGAAGQAEAMLAYAAPLRPVEHVIFHRWAEGAPEVEAMQQLGVATLGKLPGVRRIAAGTALTAQSPYPYLWTMTFANQQALAAFCADEHHVQFADTHFRPWATNRVTIDFTLTFGRGSCVTPRSLPPSAQPVATAPRWKG